MAKYRIVQQPWDRTRPYAVEQLQGQLFVAVQYADSKEEAGQWLTSYLAGPIVIKEVEVPDAA